MTAQLSDTLEYRKHAFQLAGVKGTELFEPAAHGLSPRPMSTACYRGFLCAYRVADKRLLLEELRIGLEPAEEEAVRAGRGRLLFGKRPRYSSETHERVVYERLRGPVPFSGGLLVTRGFARGQQVHLSLHPAWNAKEVHELLFEEGRLVEAIDCSEAMDRVRERLRAKPLPTGSKTLEAEAAQWMKPCFRLDYD